MLVRYRSKDCDAVKVYAFKGKKYKFPADEWTPVNNLFLFEDLRQYSDVFDTVAFFDIRLLKRMAKDIIIKGDLISTSRKSVAEKLKKFNFIRYQAERPEQGTYIFKVINYGGSDLSNYRGVKGGLHILAYRNLGGLGDIIMTTSALEKVKEKYPNSRVTYACPKEFLELLRNNPTIDRLTPWNREVTQENYDVVINLTHDCIDYEMEHQPLVERNRPEVFVSSCGLLDDDVPSPKIYLSKEEIVWAENFFKGHSHLVIGLVLKSNAEVRQWPYFEELRNRLLKQYPKASIIEISYSEPSDWKKHRKVIPIFGFKLREVAALINQCDLIVSPDTGVAHIAGALGKPAVWLFTHIDGKVRTKNYRNSHVCQVTPDTCMKGRPCWYEIPCGKGNVKGRKSFENKRNPACATELTVNMVMETCKEVLSVPQVETIVFSNKRDSLGDIDKQIRRSTGRQILLLGDKQTISTVTLHRFMIADGDIVACKNDVRYHLVYSDGKYSPEVSMGGLFIHKEAYLKVGKFGLDFLIKAQNKGLTINYIDNHEIKTSEKNTKTLPIEENKTLFFVRNGGLGDVLMTTLVLPKLKQKYFNYRIYYFCDSVWMDILKDNPYLEEVFNLRSLSKYPQYDGCIDLIESVENYSQEMGINRKPRIDRFFELCGVEGNGHYKFDYTVTKGERRTAHSHLADKKILGLGLSAIAPYRNWPLSYYEKLSKMVDLDEWQIVLFSDSIIVWSGARAKNLTGKTKVRNLFASISLCDLVVCGDTGISHICAAVDVPNIIIYGTIPSEARCSYYNNAFPIVAEDVKCAPCWDMQIGDKENWKDCRKPLGAKCVTEIKPEQVFEKMNLIKGKE